MGGSFRESAGEHFEDALQAAGTRRFHKQGIARSEQGEQGFGRKFDGGESPGPGPGGRDDQGRVLADGEDPVEAAFGGNSADLPC